MNIDITIGVTPQLEKALEGLIALIAVPKESMVFKPIEQVNDRQVQIQQPQQALAQQTVPTGVPNAPTLVTAVPTAQPIQQQTVQQAPVQPQPVPTSAPSYDMNQLAVAATQLMDAGKQPELLQLLAAFGAQSLMDLPQEQYGAFATKLRELGAKI